MNKIITSYCERCFAPIREEKQTELLEEEDSIFTDTFPKEDVSFEQWQRDNEIAKHVLWTESSIKRPILCDNCDQEFRKIAKKANELIEDFLNQRKKFVKQLKKSVQN